MIKFLKILCVFLVLQISACSGGIPSDQQITDQATSVMLDGPVGKYYKIANMKKTNGAKRDSSYVAAVEFDLIFTEDFMGIKKGTMKHGEASFRFESTEQGWVINGAFASLVRDQAVRDALLKR
jgi:hypothetical protein